MMSHILFVGRRLVQGLWTLLLVATVAFLILRLVPGDPAQAYLGDQATPELIEMMRTQLGLDRPILSQYVTYIQQLVTGDFGVSFYNRRPVAPQMLEQFKYTVVLAGSALILAVAIGIPLGLLAGFLKGSFIDLAILTSSVIWISVPAFWLGLMILVVFSIELQWFPLIGAGEWSQPFSLMAHLVLPAFTLGIRSAALFARMTRSAVAEVLSEGYVRTAFAKGVSPFRIASGHVLRNVLSIVISLIGLELSLLLGGVVVIERIFSRQGIGALLIDGVLARDFPMVQALLLFMALIVVVVHILTDVAHALADPRIQVEN